MSATADLITKYFENHKKLKFISYQADLDFSFINELYFYKTNHAEEVILDGIVNSGDKAIIFINRLERLEKLYLKYRNISLFNCAEKNKQYKYVDEDKIKKMLFSEKLEKQLIFTTTAMDTGISIKDKQLKHIIVNNIDDINVLIQSIGRKRMIDQDDKVNIYIKNIDNRSLNGYLKVANDKLDRVHDFQKNGQDAYTNKYEREIDDKAILYYQSNNGVISVNKNEMPYFKTLLDTLNYGKMLKQGYKNYISNMFSMEYTDIDIEMEKESLEEYLDSIVGEVILVKKDRKEIIEKIDVRSNGKQLKSSDSLNSALREREIDYYIDPFPTSRVINGKKKNFNSAWRVLKLVGK